MVKNTLCKNCLTLSCQKSNCWSCGQVQGLDFYARTSWPLHRTARFMSMSVPVRVKVWSKLWCMRNVEYGFNFLWKERVKGDEKKRVSGHAAESHVDSISAFGNWRHSSTWRAKIHFQVGELRREETRGQGIEKWEDPPQSKQWKYNT